jgi:hypothetical protein
VPPRKKSVRRKKVAPGSVGLTVAETQKAAGADLDQLAAQVERDGGAVLARYSDPFGGKPVLLVSLPVERVEPTPYQRDPSDAHVKRLMGVIENIGRFLDPIIAVRHDGQYWTPNGNLSFAKTRSRTTPRSSKSSSSVVIVMSAQGIPRIVPGEPSTISGSTRVISLARVRMRPRKRRLVNPGSCDAPLVPVMETTDFTNVGPCPQETRRPLAAPSSQRSDAR